MQQPNNMLRLGCRSSRNLNYSGRNYFADFAESFSEFAWFADLSVFSTRVGYGFFPIPPGTEKRLFLVADEGSENRIESERCCASEAS